MDRLLAKINRNIKERQPGGNVMTDDKAPVELMGWKEAYLAVAALHILLGLSLWKFLPYAPDEKTTECGSHVMRLFSFIRNTPCLLKLLVLNGLSACMLTTYWTALTYLLSEQPFQCNAMQISIFSLAGWLGIYFVGWTGKHLSGANSSKFMDCCLYMYSGSMGIAYFGTDNILPVTVAAIIVAIIAQVMNAIIQNYMLALKSENANSLNTIFLASNFLFAAAGAKLSVMAWNFREWIGVTGTIMVLAGLALILWSVWKRSILMTCDSVAGHDSKIR